MAIGAELAATEYGRVGLEFARALVAGRFDDAWRMLTAQEQVHCSAADLKLKYERMVAYGDGAANYLEALEGYDGTQYPGAHPNEIGGVYVAICGEGFSEAVMVFVVRENGEPRIRQIVWQRP